MKFLIILLLLLIILILYFYNKKLANLLLGRIQRNLNVIPNEVVLDLQRITDPAKRTALLQWFADQGYTELRKFELPDRVRLHLMAKEESDLPPIELLSSGTDPDLYYAVAKVELEGGQYSDLSVHKYMLFPEQKISLPNINKLQRKCEKQKLNRTPSATNDTTNQKQQSKDQYQQNESQPGATTSIQNERAPHFSLCRTISKTRFKATSQSDPITFNQGIEASEIVVALIDSRSNFNAFQQFEQSQDPSDLYPTYLMDASHDFGSMDLSPFREHGTFMASIMSAEYAGESQLKIRNYPFHDETQGHLMEVVVALYCAIEDDVDIINLSLGYPSDLQDHHLRRAFDYAGSKNILVICAAGNNLSDNDNEPFWPSNFSFMPHLASVSALDSLGNRWIADDKIGSNIGLITVSHNAAGAEIIGYIDGTEKKRLSGTSCSAALLSAKAATIKSQNPGILAPDLRSML